MKRPAWHLKLEVVIKVWGLYLESKYRNYDLLGQDKKEGALTAV